LKGLSAAAIAIAAGWTFNVAYVFALRASAIEVSPEFNDDTLAIAAIFGWVCPSLLVLVTWLVWRLAARRVA